MGNSKSAAKYKFNNFQQIKSHSSVLYNERMAILFYLLDMKNLQLHKDKSVDSMYEVYSVLNQIYKNVRMLLRFNDTVRVSMNLETKERGVYTIDVMMGLINNMIEYCEGHGFTEKKLRIIIQELDNAEMVIKEVMQYFHYFIRPDFKQKPDVNRATAKYKEMADKKTVEELRELAGKKNKINFDELGSERIEKRNEKVSYNPETDGSLENYVKQNDENELELEEDED